MCAWVVLVGGVMIVCIVELLLGLWAVDALSVECAAIAVWREVSR